MSSYNMFLKERSRRFLESVVFEILGEEKNIISVEIDYLYGKNSCKIEFGDFENYEFYSRNKKEIEKKILEQYRTRKDKNFLAKSRSIRLICACFSKTLSIAPILLENAIWIEI